MCAYIVNSEVMRLKPSEIRFSQDSIGFRFHQRSRHRRKKIGETLDDICEGRCRISDIPRITVVNEAGQWISADNRRLWVFRHLERLGKCDTIPVIKGYSIPRAKRTSNNGGTSITVRRNPGGRWYSKPSIPVQSAVQPVSSCPRPNGPGLGLQQSALPMGSSYSPIQPIHTNTRDTQEDPSLPVSTRTGCMGASEDGPEKKKARYDKADHSVSSWPRPNGPGLGFDEVSSIGPFGTRVARYSYGVRGFKNFIPGVDPEKRKDYFF